MAKKARKRPVKAPPAPLSLATPRAWKVPAAIVLLCAVLYGWTLPFPMVFDDDTYLLNNPFFRADSFGYPFRFQEFVSAPQKMGLDPDLAVNFVTRPVSYATFYLNHALGVWNPSGFRLVNVLVHSANSLLLWAVLRLLMSRLMKAGKLTEASTAFIPAAAALLFAAHPLAVESVTYIVQRFTSLAAFWSLLAAWLYFRSTEEGLEKAPVIRFRVSAAVVMLLGMLTKECAVVTPLLIVLLDVLVGQAEWKTSFRRAWPLLVTLPVIPLLVLMSSAVLNGGSLDLSAGLNIVNSRDEPVTHLQYLLTQFTVIAHYLRLMLWPSGQNIDPAWDTHSTLLSWPVAGSLFLHLALILLAMLAFRRWRQMDGRARLGLAAVLWFYLGICISSGLVPLPDMVAEHRSYLPSAGIFIMLACLFDLLRAKLAERPQVFQVIAAGLVLALGTTTVLRNMVWSSAETLWADASSKSPGKYRVWSNLGVALTGQGREKEAAKCFRKSVEIEPAFSNGVLNLANSLLRLGRPQEAISEIDRLNEHSPVSAAAPAMLYTKALGFFKTGKTSEAAEILAEVLQRDPANAFTHRLLGIIRAEQGRLRESLTHLREASRQMPGDADLREKVSKLEQHLASS
ncbi:MAG: tetratricopeptide repeat protein [Verrucomicrobiaceae bacterium]|nr:tetratricopeptide repeat protein [Verrucomicrobiaceae bacterium]